MNEPYEELRKIKKLIEETSLTDEEIRRKVFGKSWGFKKMEEKRTVRYLREANK